MHLFAQELFPRATGSPLSPEELIERVRNRDPEAWDYVFNRYYPEIYAYLRYRTASEEDAEDLAATVFERAVRSIHTYKETGRGLGPWLQRIASNLVVDYYRRRGVPGRQTEALSPKLADRSPSPLEYALQMDTVEDVRKALARLPENQRNVLIYRFLLGYSLAETADIMGKNVNAIKALQHRALQNLKKILT